MEAAMNGDAEGATPGATTPTVGAAAAGSSSLSPDAAAKAAEGTAPATLSGAAPELAKPAPSIAESTTPTLVPGAPTPAGEKATLAPEHSTVTTASSSSADLHKKTDKPSKPKLTPEQRAKLDAMEEEKEKKRKARIEDLTAMLIGRIRPFVDAKHPGDANDPETKAFEQRLRTEAEDLKLESFGVEMLHTIGQVYVTRSSNFLKSKKFFGGGFIGKLKEKGGMMKEGWGLLSGALDVQRAMMDMEKMEAKGTGTPEEIAALAEELSGKMLLTTWRATRWEVINVSAASETCGAS